MTPTGRAFGIGRTTAAAISRFLRGEHPSVYGGRSEKDNGNGSLMRILPVVRRLPFRLQGDFAASASVRIQRARPAHRR